GGQTVAATGVVASGTPREQLEQLDGVLREQGYAPTGPAVHGNLQTNGLVAYAVDAQPNRCYTLAVFGEQPNQNIDMIVLDPYGRPATHNVRPDNHPWVSFCAASGGRFIARVQMASGSGGYYYGAYQGPSGRRMELSQFFGQEPATSQVQVAQMDGETQSRLSSLDQQMNQQGYSRVGDPAGIVLDGREPRDFQLNLREGECYAFATLGGPGAVDTDVFLNDQSGTRIQADTRRDRDAMVQYCAPATGNYALQVRMYQGQGPLFTVAYVQNAAQAQQTQPVMESTSTAGAGLQENFALLDADMRARGYESYGEQTNGRLDEAGTRNFEIQLEGGRCYAILAVGDTGVRDLDLHLLNQRGQEVDRDTASDARPTVRVCPESSGNYYMQVQMTSGSGAYVYAPYRWPRGTQGPFGLEGLTWVRLSEVTALLSVEGFTPDAGFTPENGQLRRQGASATHQVNLESGQCYAIVVVGGEGVNDLDVTLSRGGTQLASDFGSRNAFPSVRQCVQQGGRHTITVSAAEGSGDYHYQVFSRTEGE
ncbi:MAG TPA: hypothetical protein RMH99_15420, partial [Sandaracinaceae bacterium LLY-WYZ-13_1]|nr:hypothetical protein [Sandaracinaceae bacterium LLY-WYZ-13_1]